MAENKGNAEDPLKKFREKVEGVDNHVCPHCGYCPHCGRPYQPLVPPYYPYPYNPYGPLWC